MQAATPPSLYPNMADAPGSFDYPVEDEVFTMRARAAALSDLTDFISHQPEDDEDQPSVLASINAYLPETVKSVERSFFARVAAEWFVRAISDEAWNLIFRMKEILEEEFPSLGGPQILSSLVLWSYLQTTERRRPERVPGDTQATQDFRNLMTFTTAAYGKAPSIHLGSFFSQSDQAWVKAYTRLPEKNILPYVASQVVGPVPEVGEPRYLLGHYACVDNSQRAVIVAVKGTLSIGSSMVNLDYNYERVEIPAWEDDAKGSDGEKRSGDGETYEVHRGMWRAANELAANPMLLGQVKTLLEDNEGYELVLCGHSLGGGVAALLSILWSQPSDGQFVVSNKIFPTEKNRSIKCYCYGPAASMDNDLATKSNSMISSVVNRNDIVSSLSRGGTQDLNIVAETIKSCKQWNIISIIFRPAQRRGLLKLLREQVALENFKKLVPPGKVWVISERKQPVRISDVQRRFNEARFVQGMVSDHVPRAYGISLSGRVHMMRVFVGLAIRGVWQWVRGVLLDTIRGVIVQRLREALGNAVRWMVQTAVAIATWPARTVARTVVNMVSVFVMMVGTLFRGWGLLVRVALGIVRPQIKEKVSS